MALLDIVKYGDPVLERPGDTVVEFDAKLKRLVSNKFETF
jgi:peptide deformylase